jgi:thiol-disulfide isomerase/thioredoxin
MNHYSNSTIKPISTGGLNVLKTGGNVTTMQKMRAYLNWKTLAILIIVILLSIFGYYMYKNYTTEQTAFKANREHVPKGQNAVATLMLFYVDWCPHCKTAKPEWDSLKAEYDGKQINGYTVVFVEHNCTNESDEVAQLMDKYNIEGYPTIKLIKDNQVIEYDAKPTKSTMEQFLNTVL